MFSLIAKCAFGRRFLLVLLCLVGIGEAAWALDAQRARGGYGSYDEPSEWPTLAEPEQSALLASEAQASASPLDARQVRALIGRELVDREGAVLGQIRAIVLHQQEQTLRAVIDLGGWLGFGARKVAIPLAQIQAPPADDDGPLQLVDLSAAAVQHLPQYAPEQFSVIEPSWNTSQHH